MQRVLSQGACCREGICGSCAMNINGTNGLACLTKVSMSSSVASVLLLEQLKITNFAGAMHCTCSIFKSVSGVLHRGAFPYLMLLLFG